MVVELALLLADVIYTLTFGRYDSTILQRSLVVDVLLPILLVVQIRRFFGPVTRRGSNPAAEQSHSV